MFNKVILVGNLGRDPEVRTMNNGDKVANFSVATSESWVKNGERQERTEWHKVVVFGKTAEFCEKHLEKGDKVTIEGQLQTRSWEDQAGQKKYTTEVVVQKFKGSVNKFWEKKNDTPNSDTLSPQNNTSDFDDEIPF